jgi:two-component system chemotaxis response regulator CheY
MHHRAFGRRIEELDVVLVEDSRPMQTILRSMLTACGVERLRVFDRAESALKDMLADPPHLLMTDWHMASMSGLRLVRAVRDRSLAPLCRAAAMLVTGYATRNLVAHAGRIGVHQVVAKPLSPALLHRRLAALVEDGRTYALRGRHYVIDGVEEILNERLEHLRVRGGSAAPAAPEPVPVEEAGALAPDAAPPLLGIPSAGRRVRAGIDSSVWGGR